ncbi:MULTISPECIES: pro-sigmaK processing inhibitor BofA family protein [Halobacillus]|uniref:Pro-sigmaK processing inhibitor BofA n=2 Tax=Halobacillus TaxID=45667 RepID=A0A3D8VP61_9BACI|nr:MULTISPECIES: pro-sigmaK processing inhibitor BofA family protein [Halobacillus]RDY71001.1 pro-sigmaK processing inhibitor BofA [Halobacillus trueperi]REJ09766.1 pro-sigmaK processing inhibitor BofA [Halobacillus trueperi]SDN87599.1 inhibitor of the pro-sigma K processing machinery [Halobacillus aidingensis]
MDPVLVILLLGLAIPLLLIIGMPTKPLKVVGQVMTRLIVAVILLFFVNLFGAQFGLHVPINGFTAIVSAILGVPGVLSLTAIHFWII